MRDLPAISLYIVAPSAPDEYEIVCANGGITAIVGLRWRISSVLEQTEESISLGHATGHVGMLKPGEVATLIKNVGAMPDVWMHIEIDAESEHGAVRFEAYLSINEVVTGEPSMIPTLDRSAWMVVLRAVP